MRRLIGCATLVGIIFTISYLGNWLIDVLVGQRVGAASELEGLDLPEMGALGYPEFQLVTSGLGRSVEVAGLTEVRIMTGQIIFGVIMLVVFAVWQIAKPGKSIFDK